MTKHFFETGSIVYVDFHPTIGHEEKGRRPALIISNNEYNSLMQLYIVCPISNCDKDFPTHIKLDNRTKTTGRILCEHTRSLDLSKRKAQYVEKIPKEIFEEVIDIVHSFF